MWWIRSWGWKLKNWKLSLISSDVLSARRAAPLPAEIREPLSRSWTLDESYAYCRRIALGHYENFPVGSVLMPKALQPAIHALYAFMRTADDFSDENRKPGDNQERLAQVQAWDGMLSDCEKGKSEHPVFIAVGDTLKRQQLPAVWLHDLLKAFAMDCTKRSYATFDDVVSYCRYSANPVGRLILTLSGYRDEERYALSDAICTGLQLANHWQDVAVDLKKDRTYLPQEDLTRFGVDLRAEAQAPVSDGFRRLMDFEVDRAQTFFDRGSALPKQVSGRLRLELRLTWRGGARVLEKIRENQFDVFRHRPVVTTFDWVRIALRSLI